MLAIAISATFVLSIVADNDEISRRLGAIAGAAVADAAAMPLHWIYDTSIIASKVAKGMNPEFFDPPSCPFYNYPEGENTPYGQQNRVILASLASAGGLDTTAVQDSFWSYYGPVDAPCSKCYLDGSTKSFLANYKAGKRYPNVGANDTQANAIVHMVPLVAALAGADHMLEEVESLIRITQNTDQAVAFGLAGARVLSKVILGETLLQAVQSTVRDLRDPARERPMQQDAALADGLERMLGQLDRTNFDVVKEVGQSCDYPFGLLSGCQLAGQLSTVASANGAQAFRLAVRQTIEAGGDSGSRGGFVGALFGAAAGESAIPASWKAKYLHYDEVLEYATAWIHGKPSQKVMFM